MTDTERRETRPSRAAQPPTWQDSGAFGPVRIMASLLGDIGSIEWSRTTNGILRGSERARFVGGVMLTTARLTPRMVAAKLGMRGSGPDPSELAPPDTQLTRDVLAACEHLDPAIVLHGIRSYLFARALAVVEGRTCDDEGLFVAAVLHDYAFGAITETTDQCFTVVSAAVAEGLLATSDLDHATRRDVLDAITRHLNPAVPAECGDLQHLLHDGVLVDVLGARAWELDPEGIARVVARHPRHEFITGARQTLRTHARLVKGSRTAALLRCGFAPALRLGPWPRVESGER